jgi:indole-3-glycerol phosphate synthase
MNKILNDIVNGLQRSVPEREQRVPLLQLKTSPHYNVPCISMVDYLHREEKNGVIAEFKRASPAKGTYRLDSDLVETTRGYMQAGCSGLSILTEPHFFKGSLDDLRLARSQHLCPILCKDFMLFPYQIHEARAAGADVVLLIAALLDAQRLREMVDLAHDLGMQILFECHAEKDLDLWIPGIEMVGVNSRNLSTLEMDADRFESMVAMLPMEALHVAESGIRSAQDIDAARRMGYSGFLIGDAFLSSSLPHKACERIARELDMIDTVS